jgi:pimeloyl-ACP methyl ester carboxylesterase
MRGKSVKIFFVLLLALAVFGPARAQTPDDLRGAVIESEFVATHSAADINRMIASFYPAEQVLPARFAADEYRVRFGSLYQKDQPIEILAQVFIPRAEQPAEFPVFVMGAGSTGLADKCAPSQERPAVQSWGNYKTFLLTIATQGYIVIMPDYAGFNDPDRIQPYYVAEMAGRVLLDAGRAVYDLFAPEAGYAQPENAAPLDAVFVAGYSQGGQSVFAAKDLWAAYAPELPLAGIIGYAPVTNMQSHMLTLPQLTPYRLYAWVDYYGADKVPLEEIFTDYWLPTLEDDVLNLCVMDAVGRFSANPAEMYRPAFLEALQNGTVGALFPELNELLELNNPGFVQNDIPALIVQGTEDRTLPMAVHERFVERYCAAGNRLTELVHAGVNHFNARQVSYHEVLDWMQQIVGGQTPPQDCP